MNVWYKIWAVGNGGMKCYEQYVYWPAYYNKPDLRADMAYEIECHFGPLSEGIRSLNWEVKKPPKEVIDAKIKELRTTRRNALILMRELQR